MNEVYVFAPSEPIAAHDNKWLLKNEALTGRFIKHRSEKAPFLPYDVTRIYNQSGELQVPLTETELESFVDDPSIDLLLAERISKNPKSPKHSWAYSQYKKEMEFLEKNLERHPEYQQALDFLKDKMEKLRRNLQQSQV